jgi:hypothetical protein
VHGPVAVPLHRLRKTTANTPDLSQRRH